MGGSLSSASNEYTDNQLIAQNQEPAPPVVINNGGGSASSVPPPPAPMVRAKTRSEDSSFMRAIAKDFSHPTAFTSAGLA